jgi:predicted nucleic acid-binding protein
MMDYIYEDEIKMATKLISLYDSARDRGIECTLTFAELKRIYKRKTCYYTGINLYTHQHHTPSLERIDNDKGYVSGNVALVSKTVNNLKNDLSLKHLKMMVKKIEQHETSS